MKRKTTRGTLVIIALLFASSGALRIGSGVGTALAQASKGHEGTEPEPIPVSTSSEVCPEPPAELAAAMSDRESRLAAQEASLQDRTAALALANEAITQRLADLKAAEEALSSTLSQADGAAEKDIARLVAVYETMKPKDASRLFDAMEPDFVAGFLGRMRPDAAAAVMAGMTPEKAYAVSAILAGRNASVPKN